MRESSSNPIAPAPGPATAAAPAVAGGWFPAHRGPLTVEDSFLVLDDPQEQSAFTETVEQAGASCAESVLWVQGMYCAACADTVESVLQGLPGVRSAQVHAATRRLSLRWDPALTRLSTLARAVGQTGYRLLPLQEALSITRRLAETRQALWRLFLSGFCMMQVMMYAWPAYVAEPGDMPADIEQLLRWASWIISLPVVFWASGPFFRNAWRDLKLGRIGMDTPVSLGILATFLVSSAVTFDPKGIWGHEVWFDSLTMFVFFLLGGRYLEFKARDRTAGALDSLMNRLPEVCERRLASGDYEAVSVRRLAAGDVVRLQAGQAFPGDGTLLSRAATVDEALLTGESRPLTRQQGEALVAGSFNLGGVVEMRVDRLGKDTRFAQIVQLMERASTDKPRLAQLADRIASPFLVLVLLAAVGAAAYWWPVDAGKALSVAVAVLIVTCPCALALATPAAMLAAAGSLARRGTLVRRLQALEALAATQVVVFDKTGTLTQDRLRLSRTVWREGAPVPSLLAQAVALASASSHPVSRAVAEAEAGPPVDWDGVELVERAGQGMEARWPDGRWLRLGSARFCGMDDPSDGGSPQVWLADSGGWLARFELEEQLREDAEATVAALRAAGLQVWMLSGDRPAATQVVAQRLGIETVVSGASPEDKLQVLTDLQSRSLAVAMVGDGLNDGPVLARADTSFTLGHAAALAQAQADFVIQGAQLGEVVRSVHLARATLRVVRQNLAWAAVYNLVSVPLAVVGWMPPWLAGLGMAGSSLLVIGNALRLVRRSGGDAASTGRENDSELTFSTSA